MNINTAEINRIPWGCERSGARVSTFPGTHLTPSFVRLAVIIFLGVLGLGEAQASLKLTAWEPLFKGVEHAAGTNAPESGDYSQRMVAHVIRVDLTDPDIKLFTSPPREDYEADSRESAGRTVSNFLLTNHLQLAVNANRFSPSDNYLPDGVAMNIAGLSICQGVVVSVQENSVFGSDDNYKDCAAMMFTTNNAGKIVFTNWPATSTEGIYTAVAGTYPILVDGVNISRAYLNVGASIHYVQPRTAFGLSSDRRYLFLLTIDGRQGRVDYSDGAYDYETADWLIQAGASDGINMDGGGSTTLVMSDSIGNAIRLNKPSTVADSGLERTVGSHFGVFAKPVPGFINDIKVVPSDTSASISWTTTNLATAQIEYGLSTNLDLSSNEQTNLSTTHTVKLSGLAPATGYYFQVVSSTDTERFAAPIQFFTTEYYVTTNLLFDITNAWTYTTANLDGVNWMAASYDDSTWLGSGPGFLYVDLANNPDVSPKNTQMPTSDNYPFRTYYFRTHFQFADARNAVSLVFSNYVDDGAVFYLNGQEIYRLRMDDAPAVIANTTLAKGYPCGGNATCPDVFTIMGSLMTHLVSGDNVLAVEVHNYSAKSPDITFGSALYYLQPYSVNNDPVQLKLAYANGQITLSWEGNGYTLQQTDSLMGVWTDIAGTDNNSYVTTSTGKTSYYRLRK